MRLQREDREGLEKKHRATLDRLKEVQRKEKEEYKDQLATDHQAELSRLRETYQQEVVEKNNQLTEDYQRQTSVLAEKEKRLKDEVHRLDGVVAGKVLLALPLLERPPVGGCWFRL